jgi:hypothetical protein
VRRSLVIGLVVVVAVGSAYLYAQRLPELRRQHFVGTWRLQTTAPYHWHIVLRDDGTGTMSDWDHARSREGRPRDIRWSVSPQAHLLLIRAVRPVRGYGGELGGRYRFHGKGDALELHHTAGPNPGTSMYVRVEEP